jgi:hypothetical protein
LSGNPAEINLEFVYSSANKHNFSSTLLGFDTTKYEIGIGLNFSGNECILIQQKRSAYGRGPEIFRDFYFSSSNAGQSDNIYMIPNPDDMEEEEEKNKALELLDSIKILDDLPENPPK